MLSSHLLVAVVAGLAATLTLFSGFGLGTLLLPAFALVFPVPLAVAATAIVHVLNNLFKLALLRRWVVTRLLLVFGLPAMLAALVGAGLLALLSRGVPLAVWEAWGRRFEITPVKLVIGLLVIAFATFDSLPGLRDLRFAQRSLPLGGLLAGFFGGLSGHQGALRAAFLVPLGLEPTAFAATQAALGTMVDLARIAVYGVAILGGSSSGTPSFEGGGSLIVTATVCAFAGSYVGTRLLGRVTMGFVRKLTGALLYLLGAALVSGVI